jgi:hypothetical protein
MNDRLTDSSAFVRLSDADKTMMLYDIGPMMKEII